MKKMFNWNFMRITVMGQLSRDSEPAACFKHCEIANSIINSIINFPKICMVIIFLKHVYKRRKANAANILLTYYFHICRLIGFNWIQSLVLKSSLSVEGSSSSSFNL